MNYAAAKAALQFYLDSGVDEALLDEPVNRVIDMAEKVMEEGAANLIPKPALSQPTASAPLIPKAEALKQAIAAAQSAKTLDELRDAIVNYDAISLKKTATNLVFADGNPQAPIMLIGEAPGADEDRQGTPFLGPSGQLLDKILKCINIERTAEDAAQSIYLTNVINWRPPGNRTPTATEIELSLPFIERHIQLAQPKLLIFCGSVAAKSLLNSTNSISKLRKKWHDYTPQHLSSTSQPSSPIPAIVTYHPAYLLQTPAQKKAVWADMLSVQSKRREMNL